MIPTPYTVGHRVHSESGLDAHNNAVDAWAAPAPLQVHAVAPGASVEAVRAGRDVSAVLWTVYAPAGTVVGSRDRIMWQGVAPAVTDLLEKLIFRRHRRQIAGSRTQAAGSAHA